MAFENISCRCPPQPNPSIPDHNTWQGMHWEHTDRILTPRWWPESAFPNFQKCTIFAQQTGPRTKSFRGKFSPPYFLLWWVWFDPKPIWEQKNWWNPDRNPHFYTHTTFLEGKRHISHIQPLTLTLDPKLINFYAEVLHVTFIYRNHWVTSDVQFRKGASIPPFWVGLDWADRTWPYTWRFPCQEYRIHTVYISGQPYVYVHRICPYVWFFPC